MENGYHGLGWDIQLGFMAWQARRGSEPNTGFGGSVLNFFYLKNGLRVKIF